MRSMRSLLVGRQSGGGESRLFRRLCFFPLTGFSGLLISELFGRGKNYFSVDSSISHSV